MGKPDWQRALEAKNKAAGDNDLGNLSTWQGFLSWLEGFSTDIANLAKGVQVVIKWTEPIGDLWDRLITALRSR